MFVEDVGVGIAADVQTAFFTTHNIDWFFPLTGTSEDIRCLQFAPNYLAPHKLPCVPLARARTYGNGV
jgi:hypothetical protein